MQAQTLEKNCNMPYFSMLLIDHFPKQWFHALWMAAHWEGAKLSILQNPDSPVFPRKRHQWSTRKYQVKDILDR